MTLNFCTSLYRQYVNWCFPATKMEWIPSNLDIGRIHYSHIEIIHSSMPLICEGICLPQFVVILSPYKIFNILQGFFYFIVSAVCRLLFVVCRPYDFYHCSLTCRFVYVLHARAITTNFTMLTRTHAHTAIVKLYVRMCMYERICFCFIAHS